MVCALSATAYVLGNSPTAPSEPAALTGASLIAVAALCLVVYCVVLLQENRRWVRLKMIKR